jgi:hypothetical protein
MVVRCEVSESGVYRPAERSVVENEAKNCCVMKQRRYHMGVLAIQSTLARVLMIHSELPYINAE